MAMSALYNAKVMCMYIMICPDMIGNGKHTVDFFCVPDSIVLIIKSEVPGFPHVLILIVMTIMSEVAPLVFHRSFFIKKFILFWLNLGLLRQLQDGAH